MTFAELEWLLREEEEDEARRGAHRSIGPIYHG